MALLSSATIGKMAQKWERAEARLKNIAEKSEESIGEAFQVIETQVGIAAWSYVNERYGKVPAVGGGAEYEILGAPADVAAGALLVLGGFLGAAGKYREHVVSLGSGSIGAFTARKFAQMGFKANQKAGGATTSGALPSPGWEHGHSYYGAGQVQPVG
jgi:hypothetical protein